jgi:hypothetical protein
MDIFIHPQVSLWFETSAGARRKALKGFIANFVTQTL